MFQIIHYVHSNQFIKFILHERYLTGDLSYCEYSYQRQYGYETIERNHLFLQHDGQFYEDIAKNHQHHENTTIH